MKFDLFQLIYITVKNSKLKKKLLNFFFYN